MRPIAELNGFPAETEAPAKPRDLAAERARLEAERRACADDLAKLTQVLTSLEHDAENAENLHEPALRERLGRLAHLNVEMRAPLHAVLGGIQLLHMEGGLTAAQKCRLDGILAAGTQMLEAVDRAIGLTDPAAEPSDWLPERAPDVGEILKPVRQVQPAPVRPANAGAVPPPGALSIMVVDDIDMNRQIAAAFLRSAGHVVHEAEGGAEAIAAAAATGFDVILMDLNMPEMTGLEAACRIRDLPGARGQTPIVALTALAFDEDVADCRAAGMNGHLSKPFSRAALLDSVRRAADMRPAAPRGDIAPPTIFSLAAFKREASRAEPPSAAAALKMVCGSMGGDARVAYPAAPQEWIECGTAPRAPRHGRARYGARPPAAGNQFVMKLRSIGLARAARLVDSRLTCEPPDDRYRHEFHWLLFVKPGEPHPEAFSATCDLWRWSRSAWRSVSVPGAAFSPDEMYRDGWRYCGPCTDMTARVEIITKPPAVKARGEFESYLQ
jgi:CheY-like chemotaxis protein